MKPKQTITFHLSKELSEAFGRRGAALPSDPSTSDLANLLFTPISSASIERALSMGQFTLMEHGHRLTKENLCRPLFFQVWML